MQRSRYVFFTESNTDTNLPTKAWDYPEFREVRTEAVRTGLSRLRTKVGAMEHTSEEIEAAIRILREDAQLEHNRSVMERLDRMEVRLNKSDEQELSDEEVLKLYREGKFKKSEEETRDRQDKGSSTGSTSEEDEEWDEVTAERHRKRLGEYDAKRRPPAPTPKTDKTDQAPPKKGWWYGYEASPKEEAV